VTARISDKSSHQPVNLNCNKCRTFDRPFITRTVSSQTYVDQPDLFLIVPVNALQTLQNVGYQRSKSIFVYPRKLGKRT
jgi:hypothetical protein